MSDRFRFAAPVLWLTFAAAVAAGPVGAQAARPDAPSLTELYRRRAAELSKIVRIHEDSTKKLVMAERATNSVAVQRGPTTVLTSSAFTSPVTAALVHADSLLAEWPFGASAPAPVTYRLRRARRGSEQDEFAWLLDVVEASGREPPAEWWPVTDSLSPPKVAELAQAVSFAERKRREAMLPVALRAWLNSGVLGITATDRWAIAYYAVATSPTVVAHSCLLGTLPACRETLMIDAPRDAILDWYTPNSRRAMVQPYMLPRNVETRRKIDAATPGVLTACIDASDDAACVRIMREQLGISSFGDPLRSAAGREALLVAAIQMPGAPGLYAIMGQQALTVRQSLEAASGTSVDAVLQSWLARIKAAEPDSVQLPAPRLMSLTAWILIFGALALGGSRWRSA